jgi:uncharacterized Fe-S radical SAM superfamily protein PflX
MARYFKIINDKIECLICPHYCKLSKGKSGICGVRRNSGEKIDLITYGVLSGYSSDPVEKKPLYHFFPGYNILSIGSYGCNLRCDFCQNCNISQNIPENLIPDTTPEKIVKSANLVEKNIGIAFTYNEPVIWFEFMRDVATLAKNEGLYTAMISNGFVTSEPLSEIVQFIDAFNIDLKAFNNNFYRKNRGSDAFVEYSQVECKPCYDVIFGYSMAPECTRFIFEIVLVQPNNLPAKRIINHLFQIEWDEELDLVPIVEDFQNSFLFRILVVSRIEFFHC